MKFYKRRVVVGTCLGAMLAILSTGSLAAARMPEAVESAIETAGQQSSLALLSADAPALAAVALIGLVGIARRRRSS